MTTASGKGGREGHRSKDNDAINLSASAIFQAPQTLGSIAAPPVMPGGRVRSEGINHNGGKLPKFLLVFFFSFPFFFLSNSVYLPLPSPCNKCSIIYHIHACPFSGL